MKRWSACDISLRHSILYILEVFLLKHLFRHLVKNQTLNTDSFSLYNSFCIFVVKNPSLHKR